MNKETQRIKYFRREIVKVFILLFLPHLIACVISSQVTTDPYGNIKWQLCWFATYFTILVAIYAVAPKIINHQISKL